MLIQLHQFELLQAIFPELKEASLEEVEHRLQPIKDYPAEAPVIASFLPLFPTSSLKTQIDLCKKLKLPNLDQQFVTFLYHAKELTQLKRPVELFEWAYFYANAFAPISLQIISAHLEPRRRVAFLKEHEEQIQLLRESIGRIQKQDPIVKSEHLLKAGIKPGVTMGLLLKEADRISINEQIYDPAPIIERLMTLSIWPK